MPYFALIIMFYHVKIACYLGEGGREILTAEEKKFLLPPRERERVAEGRAGGGERERDEGMKGSGGRERAWERGGREI